MAHRIYCVSGITAIDRRLNFLESAERKGWALEFFPAVYPPKNYEEFLVFREILKFKFNDRLLPGEVGCALSHLTLWDRLSKSDCEFYVIFEDDARFLRSPDELKVISGVDFQMINKHANAIPGAPWIGPNSSGSYGYVISKTGAQKFLSNYQKIDAPIDIMILKNSVTFGGALKVIVTEAIVSHDESSISEIGRSRIVFSGRG